MAALISLPLAAAASGVSVSGVWLDKHHYNASARSLAGTRYIAESPPGLLTMVMTNDGVNWASIEGTLKDATVSFDFSHVGGPAALTGYYKDGAIEWHDGNRWSYLLAPTPEWWAATFPDDHAGRWFDTRHVSPGSFSGTRFIAEDPPHVLTVVGVNEDTKAWFVLRGSCSGPGMTRITLDYSTYRGGGGAPDPVVGVHETQASLHNYVHVGAGAGQKVGFGGHITWPNGFYWEQVKMPVWLQQGRNPYYRPPPQMLPRLASELFVAVSNHPGLTILTLVGAALLAVRASGRARIALL